MDVIKKAVAILQQDGEKKYDSNLFKTDCKIIEEQKGKIFKSKIKTYEISKSLAEQILIRKAIHFYCQIIETYPAKAKMKFANDEPMFRKKIKEAQLLRDAGLMAEKIYARDLDNRAFDRSAAGVSLLLSQKVKWNSYEAYGVEVSKFCTNVEPLTEKEKSDLKNFVIATKMTILKIDVQSTKLSKSDEGK